MRHLKGKPKENAKEKYPGEGIRSLRAKGLIQKVGYGCKTKKHHVCTEHWEFYKQKYRSTN